MGTEKIADYVVLQDGNVELGVGDEESFGYNLPEGAQKSKAVLSFRVSPTSDSTDLVGEVKIGGSSVLSFGDLRIRSARTMHEVLTLPDLEDEVQFLITGGTGTVLFSDVVLWFQRELKGVHT